MDLIALLAALCILGAIVLGAVGIQRASASPREGLDRRLGRLMGESLGNDWEAIGSVEGLRKHREGHIPVIGNLIRGKEWVEQAAEDLERADLRLTVSEFVALRFFAAGIFGGVAFILMGAPLGIAVGALVAIIGWMLPRLYLSRAKSKRVSKLEGQLPDALSMLGNSLKAGFGLMQSLDLASRELSHPLATDIRRLMHDINVGMQTDEALMLFAKRSGSADLDIVVTAMLIQQSTGGNLAEILETVGYTMRERNRIRGEIKTLTTQQTMTGFIIGGLPVVIALAISLLNPDYIRPLYTTLPGYVMLAGAGVLETFGVIVIKKILAIEV
jgi:tight adherence protein B